jgi:hypothetical protein
LAPERGGRGEHQCGKDKLRTTETRRARRLHGPIHGFPNVMEESTTTLWFSTI